MLLYLQCWVAEDVVVVLVLYFSCLCYGLYDVPMSVVEVIYQLVIAVVSAYVVVASDISCLYCPRFVGLQYDVLSVVMVAGGDRLVVIP